MVSKLLLEPLVFLTIRESGAVGITCHELHSLATEDILIQADGTGAPVCIGTEPVLASPLEKEGIYTLVSTQALPLVSSANQ